MDAWLTRDHAAERAAIDARLAAIDDAVSGLPGVTTEIVAGLDGAPRAYISHRLRVSRLPHALAAAGAGAGSCDGPAGATASGPVHAHVMLVLVFVAVLVTGSGKLLLNSSGKVARAG